ncbi:MAG: hypothetical protein JXB04_12700 [Kiritimatiellae bacterium]|nr:hypothetical protein [Kiritimatiellia bacterium]
MQDYIVRAGGGLEALVWLVLIIFWVVIQVINRVASNAGRSAPGAPSARPRPTPASRPVHDIEAEMREFLAHLSIQPQAQAPQRPMPPPPPPPLAVSAAPMAAPAAHRIRRKTHAAPGRPYPGSPVPMPTAEGLAPAAVSSETIQQLTATTRQQLLSLPGLKLAGMPTLRTGMAPRASGLRPEWRTSAAIRRAMVSHIVLAPPPGLRPGPVGLGEIW